MDPTHPPMWCLLTDLSTLLVLSFVGAFGGYLSAIQKRAANSEGVKHFYKLAKPHMLQGAAGAIIIVTLCPVEPKIVNELFISPDPQLFIKLIALALVGGYAGVALLESFANQYAKRINAIQEKQNNWEEEEKSDLAAKRTAEQILRGFVLTPPETQEFLRALREASPYTRFDISNRADEARRQNWQKGKDTLERPLSIFQALVETDDAASNHWWYASLGYCLKDKSVPDYAGAAQCLDTAITIRGPETRSGAYEFNRAFCNIKLLPELGPANRTVEAQIRRDLNTARQFPRFNDIIDNDPTVQEWLRGQNVAQAA
jgi:hypothetical protein